MIKKVLNAEVANKILAYIKQSPDAKDTYDFLWNHDLSNLGYKSGYTIKNLIVDKANNWPFFCYRYIFPGVTTFNIDPENDIPKLAKAVIYWLAAIVTLDKIGSRLPCEIRGGDTILTLKSRMQLIDPDTELFFRLSYLLSEPRNTELIVDIRLPSLKENIYSIINNGKIRCLSDIPLHITASKRIASRQGAGKQFKLQLGELTLAKVFSILQDIKGGL